MHAMTTDPVGDAVEAAPRLPAAPRFQLDFGAVFWRLALLVLCLSEYKVWRLVRGTFPRHAPVKRIMGVLFFTPQAVFFAFAIAAAATIVIDLVFRVFVRPAMVRWYHPRARGWNDSLPVAFRLAASEQVLAEVPARRMTGCRREPGTLVCTNRKLGFYPFAWDGEESELAREQLTSIALEPTIRRVLGLVQGYPDHLVFQPNDGEPLAIIVADPHSVLDCLGDLAHGTER
jgi:hypothetical protein